MSNLTREDFLKMQESAIEHAKLMQSKAKIKDDSFRSFDTQTRDNLKSNSNFNCHNNALSSPPIPNCGNTKDSNHNISQIFKNSLCDEETILLTFILILIFDKADKILIFALIYIML